jgi:hypothetical protein
MAEEPKKPRTANQADDPDDRPRPDNPARATQNPSAPLPDTPEDDTMEGEGSPGLTIGGGGHA